MFGVEFAGLLEDPTISVGVVCRPPGSDVDLTYFVQDFVEVRKLVPIIFGGRLFMILLRAFESDVDCRALRIVSLGPALVLVASWFPISIPDFGRTWVASTAPCQPVILSRAKAGHEAC